MSNESQKKGKTKTYRDFITFEPNPIKFLNKKELELFEEHIRILKGLHNKVMTVKEIHKLYSDPETGKPIYTIKTIYRHLEKLENANLVAVAGHRLAEGSRLAEKLYCWTANIFLAEPSEGKSDWWNKEKGQDYARKLNIMLSELFQISKPDMGDFYDFFRDFFRLRDQLKTELYEKINESKALREIFGTTDVDKIIYMINQVSILAPLLRDPKLFDQLQKLIKLT